jgi:hypothetical protein
MLVKQKNIFAGRYGPIKTRFIHYNNVLLVFFLIALIQDVENERTSIGFGRKYNPKALTSTYPDNYNGPGLQRLRRAEVKITVRKQMNKPLLHTSTKPDRLPERLLIIILFSIAFAYIEAAVVVYLREIFYPAGFNFPLLEFGINISPLWKRLLLTEIGRETATLVLMLSASWLLGKEKHQRFTYFLIIFAVWDIFYYIWLKLLTNWPASIMEWDILFLIPVVWASPVLAPILVSITMLCFAVIILYKNFSPKPFKAKKADQAFFCLAALIVVTSFCIGGLGITKSNFVAYFSWLIFALGEFLAVATFIKCLLKSI